MTIQLDSLTIRGFRGIRYEEQFEFDRKNSVILGPNGSGKSTILHAIEFLLTGNVSALSGSGTGGITAKQHVPNRYADPDETAVRGNFSTEDGESFQAVREFTDRKRLTAEQRPAAFQSLVTAANQGLTHLSRDELLELVIATPGNRKDQIYHLMDTEGLDGRRRQLKRLRRNAENKTDEMTTRYEEYLEQIRGIASEKVTTTIDGETELRPAALCDAVNARRQRLSGDAIENIDAVDSFRDRLTSPVEQASNPLQRGDVQQWLSELEQWYEQDEDAVRESLDKLRQELRALRADKSALDDLAERSLVKHSRELVDSTTRACPLCKQSWERGELQTYLKERAERLERIEDRITTIDDLATDVRERLDSTVQTLDRILNTLSTGEVQVDLTPLAAYQERIDATAATIDADFAANPTAVALAELELPATSKALETVTELQAAADELPDKSSIEVVWDQLQTLSDAYQGLQDAATKRKQYARTTNELERAHETFLASRDDVLEEIFETISDRFAAFYQAVNPDEDAFSPAINQKNTGVDFSVEFYDTGAHPPNALHSEGHQDLMGVCLFFALAAELSPLEKQPMLLDDVVMSVDKDHREQFANVLQAELSDHFQLLITTHDESWANQLVDAGVVKQTDAIRFVDWSPDQGPVVESGI